MSEMNDAASIFQRNVPQWRAKVAARSLHPSDCLFVFAFAFTFISLSGYIAPRISGFFFSDSWLVALCLPMAMAV